MAAAAAGGVWEHVGEHVGARVGEHVGARVGAGAGVVGVTVMGGAGVSRDGAGQGGRIYYTDGVRVICRLAAGPMHPLRVCT